MIFCKIYIIQGNNNKKKSKSRDRINLGSRQYKMRSRQCIITLCIELLWQPTRLDVIVVTCILSVYTLLAQEISFCMHYMLTL